MLNCTIDSRGLWNGIVAAAKYSRRTLPQIVNTSAYWISVNAKNALPFVTVDKIDSELAAIAHPVIGKRGKPLKNRKRFSSGLAQGQKNTAAPIAALIIMARAVPDSRYNRLTNRRYMLGRNPFAGVSRSAGRAAMAADVDQMIKSRHRSPKFLLAGWIPAVRKMAKFAVQKFMRGGGSPPSAGAANLYSDHLGDASPAVAGDLCQATIENDVGTEGQNAASFNRALLRYGVPTLQDAVDREGEQQMAYGLKKAEAELAQEVKPFWG